MSRTRCPLQLCNPQGHCRLTLKGIVDCLPLKLNNGLIVKEVLRDIARQSADGVDFIMCLGDHISDENIMFTSCFSFIAEMEDEAHATPGPPVVNEDGTHNEPMEDERGGSQGLRDPMYCYTVAVGKKPSHASMWVTDASEVANALVVLAKGDYPMDGLPAWGRENATHLFT
jgi:trehalose 6-phosphate synthase/phosphatase